MARHDERIDCAGSDDYDTLLFGAPVTLRKLTGAGGVEIMRLSNTLQNNNITWEQLVDIGILSGTDFNVGLKGVGPKTALKEIIRLGDVWKVLEERSESIEYVDRVRELFLQPEITEKYEFDLGMSPDIEGAKQYIIKDWEVPIEKVELGLDKIGEMTNQTGLNRWL
jgi:flap endonuclease-1